MSFNLKDRVGSSRYTGLETAPVPNVVVERPADPEECSARPSPRRSVQRPSIVEAQSVVRAWDLDGDGVISPPELMAAARTLQSREKQVRSWRCLAGVAAIVGVLVLGCLFATVLAGNEIAKDMKPNESGVLLDKRTLAPVATGQATVSHDVRSLVDAPQHVLQELKYITLSTGGRLEHFRIDGWTLQTSSAGDTSLTVYTPRGVSIEITRSDVKLYAFDPLFSGQKLTSDKFALLDTSTGTAGSTSTSSTTTALSWTCTGYNTPVLPALSSTQWAYWGGGFQFPGDGSIIVSAGLAANNFWDITVLKDGIWLYPGFQYTLVFKASGTGFMTAKAGWNHDPYLAHVETKFAVTSTPQQFQMTFTVTYTQSDNFANSIAFFFGHNTGTFTVSGVCIWATACQSSQTCLPPPSGSPTSAPASTRPDPKTFANLRGVAYGPWVSQYAQWSSVGMSGDLQLLWNSGVRAIRTYGSDSYNDLDKVPQAAYALGMKVFTAAALTCPIIPLGGAPARPCKPWQSCLALNSAGSCPYGTSFSSSCPSSSPCDASAGSCVPRDQSVCPVGTNDEELIQLNNAVQRAKQTSGVVIVGNEVLLHTFPGALNSTGLITQMQWIRQQFGSEVAIAYADSWYGSANPDGDTDGNPATLTASERQQLASAVDILLVHIYPFWDNCYGNWSHFTGDLIADMKIFVDYVEMRFLATKQLYPNTVVLLGETGHPSGGSASCVDNVVGNKYNTVSAQSEFLKQLSTRATLRGFLFEAFDEPWKGGSDHVESNWGVFYSTRTAKPNLLPQLSSWLSN